jgi:hypothetical protein
MSTSAGIDDGYMTGLTGYRVNRPHAYRGNLQTRQTRHVAIDGTDGTAEPTAVAK